MSDKAEKIRKSDKEWQDVLSKAQYQICRCGGTEPPFTGALLNEKREGLFLCAACNAELFTSETKYDSGSGWPSFYAPIDENAVTELRDTSHGMVRTEARCARCDSHLGHIFPDGPAPTGLRYCINSLSLNFQPA